MAEPARTLAPTFAKEGNAYTKMPGDYSAKKTQIVNAETGRVHNQTVVSSSCPEWMKSPFESQRQHFERMGIQQELKTKQQGSGSLQAGADRLETDSHEGNRRRPRTNGVVKETGQLCNKTIVSREAPQFMKSPFEANRIFFEEKGVAQKIHSENVAQKPSAKEFGGSKKIIGMQRSQDVPDWMASRNAPSTLKGRAASCTSPRSRCSRGTRTSKSTADPNSTCKPSGSSGSRTARSTARSYVSGPESRASTGMTYSRSASAGSLTHRTYTTVTTSNTVGGTSQATAQRGSRSRGFDPPARR